MTDAHTLYLRCTFSAIFREAVIYLYDKYSAPTSSYNVGTLVLKLVLFSQTHTKSKPSNTKHDHNHHVRPRMSCKFFGAGEGALCLLYFVSYVVKLNIWNRSQYEIFREDITI